ncbi:isochorismate synthase [Rarobacter faecitabidus]|uniref:isochorismate synthase n=1 Tax=Rarobacter faecitabidus TaxID=13243 RepID=A0A542ZB99_RARFA|nr:isochorismate synthase [Rarobacter faecitabidus]TQL57520.1 isochorismate synthase [Rarobacter faecitabidus]
MSFSVSRGGTWWSAADAGGVSLPSIDPELPDILVGALARLAVPAGTVADGALAVPDAPGGTMTNGLLAAHEAAPADGGEPLDGTGPVAAGYFGFESDAPAVFEVASSLSRGPVPRPNPQHVTAVTAVPAREDYERAVADVLGDLTGPGPLAKIVLGRWADVEADRKIDTVSLAAALALGNPEATVMRLAASTPDGPQTLVTATPELLIARRGRRVTSRPLAGSAVRHPDPVRDARQAEALLADAKNLREHRFVVEAIADTLLPLCIDLRVPGTPGLVSTPAMWHLATEITGTLRDDVNVAALAQLLHPTPAVAGTPTDLARDLIARLETRPRGPLTGAAGWMTATGDGEFHVVIRAALVAGNRARLFAGAGIVAGSVPRDEALETAAKMRTVLTALGLSQSIE